MDDSVDRVLAQWRTARPDLDPSPMGVIGRLSRASRLTERALQKVFTEHGLQPGEFDILATLLRAGGPRGMTAGALAASAMVTSGAITNRIDRLVTKALVTRDTDPANRRTVLIDLTPSGRELINRAVADHLTNEERLLDAFSPRQREKFTSLLRTLLISLGDEYHLNPPPSR